MNRRAIAAPILALAAATALGACGGAASPAPATADRGGTPAATAPAAPAPSASPAAEMSTSPSSAPTAAPAAAPLDACALLAASEVAPLVPEATAELAAAEDGPIPSYTCTWNAAVSGGMIPVSLAVTASPGFVSGSGTTAGFVTAMIEAEGSDPENNGRVVDGLGDAASVTSVVDFDATAQFLQGDTLVQVVYTGENGAARQDAVVELARAVAGRLP